MTPREKELTRQLEEARRENALLRQKIDLLVKRVFGSSSEPYDPAQLELLLSLSERPVIEVPARPPAHTAAVARARKARAARLPENLPVVEEVLDPEPVQAQPAPWRCIGQEVSEQLDYEPGRFLRRRVVRRKYVHRVKVDAARCRRSLEKIQPGLTESLAQRSYLRDTTPGRRAGISAR